MGVLAALLALLASVPQQERTPTFGASVAAVALDVVVVDADGRPVADLRPEDFVLRIDKTPRRVVSAHFRAYAAAASEVLPAEDAPFSTNEGFAPGRLLSIVVDQDSLDAGATRSMTALGSRLFDSLGPRDQTALLTLPGPRLRVPYTADHTALRAGLGSVFGRQRTASARLDVSDAMAFVERDSLAWEQVTARQCPPSRNPNWEEMVRSCIQELESEARVVAQSFSAEAGDVVVALRGLVASLGKLPGTKQVVLLSGGFGDERVSDLETLADEAAAARVFLHVVLLDSAGFDASQGRISRGQSADRALRTEGPMRLAGLAGGGFHRVVGAGEAAFDRLASELSGDYVIGFEPEAADADGRSHAVTLDVRRPGLSVRSGAVLRIAAAAVSTAHDDLLSATLKARDLRTELPLRVATYSLRDPKSHAIRVLLSADAGRRDAPRRSVAALFALVDAQGKVAASGHQPMSAPDAASGAALVRTLVVPPGRYTLKLAAIDAAGSLGSVVHSVRASLTESSGLSLGDLILAVAAPEDGAAPRPGVDVEVAGGSLAAYLELYSADPARLESAAVSIEVAASGGGAALLSVPASTRVVGEGRRALQGRIDASLLPPGIYEARAVVSQAGETVRRTGRPFRVAAAATGPRALVFEDVAPVLPRFDAASVLRADFIGPALLELQERAPGPAAGLARGLANEGRFAEIDAVARGAGHPLAVAFLSGISAYAEGRRVAAAEHFRASLRVASDFFPAAIYLGACYAAEGKHNEAAGAWQTSMLGGDQSLGVQRLVAEALLRGRDTEQALEWLEDARRSFPEDPALQRSFGLALAIEGRRSDALVALGAYADGHPQDLDALYFVTRLSFDDCVARPSDAEARDRLRRHANAYLDAGGPQAAAVARWLEFVQAR